MNIYIGNLDRQANEVEIKNLFTQFGDVKSVKVIKDNLSGEPRGFAFVEMPDDQSASQAISNLNDSAFKNKRLKVNEARPKNSAPRAYNSFSSNYGFKDRFNKY